MISDVLKALVLLPFEIFGKIVETVLFPRKTVKRHPQKSHERLWIDQVTHLRRVLRENEKRHRQQLRDLEDSYQGKLRKLQRQQSSR